LLGGHRPGIPGFDHTTYRRSGEFWQQDYAAIGMHKELNPIARLQSKMPSIVGEPNSGSRSSVKGELSAVTNTLRKYLFFPAAVMLGF
jgi:hypothetical protein